MVQATTPTFILTLPETVDLSLASHIAFSLVQGRAKIKKFDSELVVDGQTVSVYLTQEDTLKFVSGSAKLQLNWSYADGSRACSNIVELNVSPNLLPEVIR